MFYLFCLFFYVLIWIALIKNWISFSLAVFLGAMSILAAIAYISMMAVQQIVI